jgi:hypothetical protein
MMMVGPLGGVVLFGTIAEDLGRSAFGLRGFGGDVPALSLAKRTLGKGFDLARHLSVDWDPEQALKDWQAVMSAVSAPWRDASKAARNWLGD